MAWISTETIRLQMSAATFNCLSVVVGESENVSLDKKEINLHSLKSKRKKEDWHNIYILLSMFLLLLLLLLIIIIIIIIIIIPNVHKWCFLFWSLSDSKSLQVSRTLLSIQADFSSAVV